MNKLEAFREIFWDAFHRPTLKTPKLREIWEQLEPVNNILAGPLYAIYDHGDCHFVFQDKHRFPGMNDPDDFLNWCMELVKQYKERAENVVLQSEDELQDRRVLLYQTDLKMELADLAYSLLMEQWDPETKGPKKNQEPA